MVEDREFEYPVMMTDDEIARLSVLVSEVDRPMQPPLPWYATAHRHHTAGPHGGRYIVF
jgi:hypothetical protein